jgi:hypothetical protein
VTIPLDIRLREPPAVPEHPPQTFGVCPHQVEPRREERDMTMTVLGLSADQTLSTSWSTTTNVFFTIGT